MGSVSDEAGFATLRHMPIDVTPLSPLLGARIDGADLSKPLSRDDLDAINRAWVTRGVIVFPGQTLDTAAQVRFGEQFGELVATLGEYPSNDPEFPQVMYVSNEKQDGRYLGALPDGEMYFHTDMCYVERPIQATMLYAIAVPRRGGNTRFASGFAAYDALSPERKAQLKGLRANHIFDPANQDWAGPAADRRYASTARQWSHPVAPLVPEANRRTLYVNRLMTRHIEGMPATESRALLDALFTHQEDERFVYQHVWTPGDLVMWDNRSTLHARTNFDAGELRKMRRIAVRGTVPAE